MASTLEAIRRTVSDIVRVSRRGDRTGYRERKSEFPLSLEERNRLEEKNKQILKKEDFGREDFGDFCRNMIALCKEGAGSVVLNDRNINFIYFKDNSIEIHNLSVIAEDTDINNRRSIVERGEKIYYQDFQPVLDSTTTTVIIPKPIEVFSYFSGKQSPVLVGAMPYKNESVKVLDKDVQDFCRRVYGVYGKSKEAVANSLPR